jgi:hypothetical protein
MKKIITLTAIIMSANATSGTIVSQQQCPNLTSEGQSLVTKLNTLAQDLKTSPECAPIAEQITNVNTLITSDTWKSFKASLSGEEVEALEGDAVDKLASKAEEVSNSIVQTINSLKSNEDCVPKEKKASFLNTLAGVTKEVSGVVASATGPYGMAIALGGNILSGAINTIDKLYKKNKLYNFKDTQEQMLFMNQFCSFTEAQQEVNDYLKIDQREEDLGELKKYLLEKKESLNQNCTLCKGIFLTADHKKMGDIFANKIAQDHVLQTSENAHYKDTTLDCSMMDYEVFNKQSELSMFYNQVEKYYSALKKTNDTDIIGDGGLGYLERTLEASLLLPKMFYDQVTCNKLVIEGNTELVRSRNEVYKEFIATSIPSLNKKIFSDPMNKYEFLANKKYVSPLGQYSVKTIDRLRWIEKHSISIKQKKAKDGQNIEEDFKAIIKNHEELKERMVNKLLPAYLNFKTSENKKTLKSFAKDLKRFRKRQLKKHSKIFNKNLVDIPSMIAQIKSTYSKKTNNNIARKYLSEQISLTKKLQLATLQTKSIKRLCSYLLYVSSYKGKTDKLCTDKVDQLDMTYKSFLTSDISGLQEYESWADENLNIQKSTVQDYAKHIGNWISQGKDRWTINTKVIPKSVKENIQTEIERLDNKDLFKLR